MKTIFYLFAVCLVATHAALAPATPEALSLEIESIIQEAEQAAKDTAVALEQQLDKIIGGPRKEIDAAVQSIEDRREESEECVEAHDQTVTEVVDVMHEQMNVCATTASRTSLQIVIDVTKATKQLVFDGYDLLKTYKKCKKYKNSVLKTSCYTRLSIKATLYLNNARKSIKTIKNSNKRTEAVLTDGSACTQLAADRALGELNDVHTSIDDCVNGIRY